MPLPRYLVPVAAALNIAGLVAAVVVAINNKPGAVTTSTPADSRGIADLLALKADAEKLAIGGFLLANSILFRNPAPLETRRSHEGATVSLRRLSRIHGLLHRVHASRRRGD